jgi:flagellar assembly factor FliW
MPSIETKYFGRVSHEAQSLIEFPKGLPGFEQSRLFLALQFEESRPLIFLQSAEDAGLCFITLPILAIDPQYQLRVESEDRSVLGLPVGRPLRIGDDVLCLAVVSIRESGPTANLLGPIVVNLGNQKAVQAVAAESGYSHQHALVPEEAPVCS